MESYNVTILIKIIQKIHTILDFYHRQLNLGNGLIPQNIFLLIILDLIIPFGYL
jgi:hypothetical protein